MSSTNGKLPASIYIKSVSFQLSIADTVTITYLSKLEASESSFTPSALLPYPIVPNDFHFAFFWLYIPYDGIPYPINGVEN